MSEASILSNETKDPPNAFEDNTQALLEADPSLKRIQVGEAVVLISYKIPPTEGHSAIFRRFNRPNPPRPELKR